MSVESGSDRSAPPRRAFLRGAAVTAAVAGATRVLGAGTATAAARPQLPAPRAAAAPSAGAAIRHLLRRTTFAGPTPEALAAVTAAGGRQRWLAAQLAPSPGADATLDRTLDTLFPLAHAAPPAVYAAGDNGSWQAMDDLVCWTLGKHLWSRNQLFEVMCEFWSNHLNIATPSSEPWATKPSNDVEVVRRHALGRFEDMLAASVVSPAMLHYLTNTESSKKAPNENLGREMLELHSVGRDAGYGQDGVVDAARVLTGLTTWNPWNGGTADNLGTLRYRPDWHWTGPVRVLDWTHPNADRGDGVAVAQSLARYLAGHPATAKRIATKLVVRFVSDTPAPALVARLARTYLDNGTAIVPVLRALFASPEFAASTGRKYRRPLEDAAAAVRALGITLAPRAGKADGLRNVRWALANMGHAPLGWHPPDGYPDVAGAWLGTGTVLGRWNFHVALTGRWWKDGLSYPDPVRRLLPGSRPTTRRALVRALTDRLLPGLDVPKTQHDALVAYLGGDGPIRDGDLTWQFELLVALVLHSPQWSVR
jgi:uncharacterized protein (DUF1800 family)